MDGNPARIDNLEGSISTPVNDSYTFETEPLELIVKEHIQKCQTETEGNDVYIGVIEGASLAGTC